MALWFVDPLAQALQVISGGEESASAGTIESPKNGKRRAGPMKEKRWQKSLIMIGGAAWVYVVARLSSYPELVMDSLQQLWHSLGFF